MKMISEARQWILNQIKKIWNAIESVFVGTKNIIVSSSVKVWNVVKYPFVKIGEFTAYVFNKLPQHIQKFISIVLSKVGGFFKAIWDHAESLLLLLAAGVGLVDIIQDAPFMQNLPAWVEQKGFIVGVSAAIILALLSIMKLRNRDTSEEDQEREDKKLQAAIRKRHKRVAAKKAAAEKIIADVGTIPTAATA